MSAALRQVMIRYGSYPVVMLPAAVAAAAVASSVLPELRPFLEPAR